MLKEEIGKAAVRNSELTYYVYSSEQNSGICITQTKIESASGSVTGGHTRAVKLAQTLLRNLVFPDNLSEILDDYNLPDEAVPKVET